MHNFFLQAKSELSKAVTARNKRWIANILKIATLYLQSFDFRKFSDKKEGGKVLKVVFNNNVQVLKVQSNLTLQGLRQMLNERYFLGDSFEIENKGQLLQNFQILDNFDVSDLRVDENNETVVRIKASSKIVD